MKHVDKNIMTMKKVSRLSYHILQFWPCWHMFLFLLNVQIHREDDYRAVIRSDALNSHTYSYSLKSDGEGLFSNTIYK